MLRAYLLPAGLACLLSTALAPAAVHADGPAPASPPPAVPAPAMPAPEAGPEAAWKALQQRMADPAQRRGNALQESATAWLAGWQALGRAASAAEQFWLGSLLQAARRADEARAAFEQAAGAEGLEAALRVQAAVAWGSLVRSKVREGAFTVEQAKAALARLGAWVEAAAAAPAAQRGLLLQARATLQAHAGDAGAAVQSLLEAAEADAGSAVPAATEIVRVLVESVRGLEQLPGVRAQATQGLARLAAVQQRSLDEAQSAVQAAQGLEARTQAASRLVQAQGGLEAIESARLPLDLLGEAAAPWTVVKAYGAGQQPSDWRGKVVVLDFWATWCHWCIRSFPALRDLQQDYRGKDLVVVGVTASGGSVYEQRYDLDDDLNAKAGAPVAPVARRPVRPVPPQAGAPEAEVARHAERMAAYEQELAAYRAREQEVIATFIANHGMDWPVVLVDEREPAAKYALRGWPHCVVIDRQGRIRHFKSGALLREKPEALAAFRAVLDRLLAEPALTR
ncbi:MAG: TlpA family protein disulfide reductase [Planctomycetia bacterium]